MTVDGQGISQEIAPGCYRHPDRKTWVTCGRCGRPLCPDCMRHGPVGVRCDECLRPPRMVMSGGTPEHVGIAVGVGVGQALFWVVLLILSGLLGGTFAPNIFLSGIAGGMVGWTIWRIAGRAWNAGTVRWTVAIGVLMPLLAALVLLAVCCTVMRQLDDPLLLGLRTCCAVIASGAFAFLLVKRRQ